MNRIGNYPPMAKCGSCPFLVKSTGKQRKKFSCKHPGSKMPEGKVLPMPHSFIGYADIKPSWCPIEKEKQQQKNKA